MTGSNPLSTRADDKGDHPYRYLGSAIWFTRIGHAMAEAMMELPAAP